MKPTINKIRNALTQLVRVEQRMRGALRDLEHPDVQDTARNRVLAAILQAGGSVTTDELRRIAREIGYDTRGLGGFFHGERRSLERTPDGLNRLTSFGKRLAHAADGPAGDSPAEPLPVPVTLRSGRLASEVVMEDRR